MQIKSLLALGLAAVASANPVVEVLDRDLAAKNPCDGGRQYCGWYDKKQHVEPQCKCPKGFDWDDNRRGCRAPPLPKPKTGSRQKAICARSKKDYCDYGTHLSFLAAFRGGEQWWADKDKLCE
jgi:hypothetical protein